VELNNFFDPTYVLELPAKCPNCHREVLEKRPKHWLDDFKVWAGLKNPRCFETFDPTPEQQNVVLVNAATLTKPRD